MSDSIFLKVDFFSLILFSIILPGAIYFYLLRKSAISRNSVLVFSMLLILIAGIDVFLLQRLAVMAKDSASLLDDYVFSSELSVALYLLPVLFAGVGINATSHILISHLTKSEKRYDQIDK